MATSKHIEHLEKLRVRLRHERRLLAVRGSGVGGRRDLIEFGELQRSFEAVASAIKDETEQAKAEAKRVRLANQPEDQEDKTYEPIDDDPE